MSEDLGKGISRRVALKWIGLGTLAIGGGILGAKKIGEELGKSQEIPSLENLVEYFSSSKEKSLNKYLEIVTLSLGKESELHSPNIRIIVSAKGNFLTIDGPRNKLMFNGKDITLDEALNRLISFKSPELHKSGSLEVRNLSSNIEVAYNEIPSSITNIVNNQALQNGVNLSENFGVSKDRVVKIDFSSLGIIEKTVGNIYIFNTRIKDKSGNLKFIHDEGSFEVNSRKSFYINGDSPDSIVHEDVGVKINGSSGTFIREDLIDKDKRTEAINLIDKWFTK